MSFTYALLMPKPMSLPCSVSGWRRALGSMVLPISGMLQQRSLSLRVTMYSEVFPYNEILVQCTSLMDTMWS